MAPRSSLSILLLSLSTLLICTEVVQAGGGKTKARQSIQCPRMCDLSQCPTIGSLKVEDCPRDLIVMDSCGCCQRCNVTAPAMKAITTQEEACQNIKCSKKEMCVLNLQGLPICVCPTDKLCQRFNLQSNTKMKVCGTNGETYPSRCHLKVASCKSERKVRVKSLGPCPMKTTAILEKTSPTTRSMPVSPGTVDDSASLLRGSLSSIGSRQAYRGGKMRDLSTKELRRLLRKGELSPREIVRAKQQLRLRQSVVRPSSSKFSRALGSNYRYRQMRKALA